MFKKKKMYVFVYKDVPFEKHITKLISAKNEHQALRRFYRKLEYGTNPSIVKFEEFRIGESTDVGD